MGHVSSGLGKSKSFFSILASWNRSKLEFKPKRERMLSLSTLNTTYLHVHAQKRYISRTSDLCLDRKLHTRILLIYFTPFYHFL